MTRTMKGEGQGPGRTEALQGTAMAGGKTPCDLGPACADPGVGPGARDGGRRRTDPRGEQADGKSVQSQSAGERGRTHDCPGGEGEAGTHRGEDTALGPRLAGLVASYRLLRRQVGVRKADRTWMEVPVAAWMHALSHPGPGGQPDEGILCALGVAMNETLPIRDALLVSLLIPSLSPDRLLELCVNPHSPVNVRLLCDALEGVFKDHSARVDPVRCGAGRRVLEGVADLMEGSYRAQPQALIAYVLWWSGEGDPAGHALKALAADGSCTLASIILSMVSHDLNPAWVRGR